jgi:hypothetical protein
MEEKDLFEGFDPARYEEEARSWWGETPAWMEAHRRTRGYARDDGAAIREESREIAEGIAARMKNGSTDDEVQRLVGKHHEHLNGRYSNCSVELFRRLADAYADDPRFTATWEKIAPGMAQFMQAAMIEYCSTREGKAGA